MADATDLKSVILWVCGFESRSGHHIAKKSLESSKSFQDSFLLSFGIPDREGESGKAS